MPQQTKVTAFDVVALGVDHPQYFQGVSALGTTFDCAVYGIGNDSAEAYRDAVEQIAQHGHDTAKLPKHPRGIRASDTFTPEGDDDERQMYVVIFYNVANVRSAE